METCIEILEQASDYAELPAPSEVICQDIELVHPAQCELLLDLCYSSGAPHDFCEPLRSCEDLFFERLAEKGFPLDLLIEPTGPDDYDYDEEEREVGDFDDDADDVEIERLRPEEGVEDDYDGDYGDDEDYVPDESYYDEPRLDDDEVRELRSEEYGYEDGYEGEDYDYPEDITDEERDAEDYGYPDDITDEEKEALEREREDERLMSGDLTEDELAELEDARELFQERPEPEIARIEDSIKRQVCVETYRASGVDDDFLLGKICQGAIEFSDGPQDYCEVTQGLCHKNLQLRYCQQIRERCIDISQKNSGLIASIARLGSARKIMEGRDQASPDQRVLQGWFRVSLVSDSDLDERALASALRTWPEVRIVELNYAYEAAQAALPDTFYGDLWALDAMDVQGAWEVTSGSSGTVIALLDTGVDRSHPDLDGNIWINPGEDTDGNGLDDDSNYRDDDNNGYTDDISGMDFVDTFLFEDTDPSDMNGHGTHMAGIIAAEQMNGQGTVGVCPNCRIMPVRVLDHNGRGYADDIAAGIAYAAANGARVISLGMAGDEHSTVIASAIEYARSLDVIMVAPSGSQGRDMVAYPASDDQVMAVGAVGPDLQRMFFSNAGDRLDLVAPGHDIYSASIATPSPAFALEALDQSYGVSSGSSMAAAHVCGIAGLLISHDPALTAIQVERIMRQAAVDAGEPGPDPEYGYSIVNAGAALEAAD